MCGLPNVISEKACQRCNDSLLARRLALESLTLGHAPIRPNEQTRILALIRQKDRQPVFSESQALRPPPSPLPSCFVWSKGAGEGEALPCCTRPSWPCPGAQATESINDP